MNHQMHHHHHHLSAHHQTPSDGIHNLGRKKRRGMIEKRRRDRINNSLNELRRLVPAAFEKQGSAKLEKAEILQMTVDHLTMLHAKGFDAFSFDPHKFAMDYHSIGFRECTSEVSRYLMAVEGMDSQDPLRLRLLSHLQCYATQRELSLKSSAQVSSWNPSAFTTPLAPSSSQFALPPPPPPLTASGSGPSSSGSESPSSSTSSWNPHSTVSDHQLMVGGHHHHHHLNPHGMMAPPPPPPPLFKSNGSPPPNNGSSMSSSAGTSTGTSSLYTSSPTTTGYGHHHHQYPYSPYGSVPNGHPSASAAAAAAAVKSFRPWGGELVY